MGVETRLDTADAVELDRLLAQNPDWITEYPDVYRTLNPIRYSKNKHYLKEFPVKIPERKPPGTVPKSDYQATYHAHACRPRSTKRPPPSPRDLNPAPMTFSTNQRTEFVPVDINARAKIIEPKENYSPPTDPFVGITKYCEEFPPKYAPLPGIQGEGQIKVNEGQIKRNSGRFDGRTTYKEQHVAMAPNPSLAFGELPSFADSILYPEKRAHRVPEPTTRATYRGRQGERAGLVEQGEGNIRLEGEQDHATVNRLTYKQFPEAQRAQRVDHRPQIVSPAKGRGKFQGDTQFTRDYGPKGRQPEPPRPITPPPATIDLKFDNKYSYSTEQRQQFQGVDASKHPVPKSCKKDTEVYEKPSVKMETTTNQKDDYKQIDVSSNQVSRVKRNDQFPRPKVLPKFDDHTTSKDYYKKWAVEPRKRYVDFHDANKYVPPQNKFQGATTTADAFVGTFANRPKDFKPEDKKIELEGTHDFNTVYRGEYTNLDGAARKLPPEDARYLLKEMRRRKGRQRGVLA